jgi:two-component system response regulator
MIRSARVLLVEDNLDDVLQVSRILKSCGLHEGLDVAHDGEQAIDVLSRALEGARQNLPDLVILDLKLPKISGLEVLKWIRADQRLGDIPVVILTGSREDSALVEVHRHGVLGYFVKPLTSQDFVRTVAGCVALAPR